MDDQKYRVTKCEFLLVMKNISIQTNRVIFHHYLATARITAAPCNPSHPPLLIYNLNCLNFDIRGASSSCRVSFSFKSRQLAHSCSHRAHSTIVSPPARPKLTPTCDGMMMNSDCTLSLPPARRHCWRWLSAGESPAGRLD